MSILEKYEPAVREAITLFWNTRDTQIQRQIEKNVVDRGMRAAVTGGKQLDGFINLMRKISIDTGIPKESIYTKANIIPGYFRPTKAWDFFIVSPKKHLMACIEFKSQVGSVGKNFNNRVEEALGSAVDLWTAFNEGAFPNQEAPWVGYLLVVEKNEVLQIAEIL